MFRLGLNLFWPPRLSCPRAEFALSGLYRFPAKHIEPVASAVVVLNYRDPRTRRSTASRQERNPSPSSLTRHPRCEGTDGVSPTFAKGPSAECRPQDETPALRRDRRRFTYVLRLSTDGNHRSDHYSPGRAFWAASEATRSPDRTAAHLGESLRSSLRPDLTPRSVRLI